MKIALFGATGKTGTEVVRQSMSKGYEVNALVRDPSKLQVVDSKLKLYTGDAIRPDTYSEVVDGVSAVVVTLSGIMTDGIKNILTEMKTKNVNKIILMSSYPMSGSIEGMNYLKSAGMDQVKIDSMMAMIEDKASQEKIVMESGINWIIVRPTFLKDDPKSGIYQIHTEDVQFNAAKNGISRADVADFILKSLKSSEWDNKTVSISG